MGSGWGSKMNERIDSLQALRGVAALSVVVLHCFHVATKVGVPMGDVPVLAIGVDIFFVLSGFLMFTLAAHGGTGAAAGAIFFVKRAARIYPLWWLALAVQVGILVLGGQTVDSDRRASCWSPTSLASAHLSSLWAGPLHSNCSSTASSPPLWPWA